MVSNGPYNVLLTFKLFRNAKISFLIINEFIIKRRIIILLSSVTVTKEVACGEGCWPG